MAARAPRRCRRCGKVRYRSAGHARRQLDAARQAAAASFQPPETWPVGSYPCDGRRSVWHHHSDRRAREELVRRNNAQLNRLLAAAA